MEFIGAKAYFTNGAEKVCNFSATFYTGYGSTK